MTVTSRCWTRSATRAGTAHLARRRRTARAVGQGEDRLVLGGPPKAR
ncbi:hypothetical protein [Streptomyces sp. NPDC059604]